MANTMFEESTQNGVVVGHMQKYFDRRKHTFEIQKWNGPSGMSRVYRLIKSDGTDTEIFRFEFSERPAHESPAMWAHRTRRELDLAWARRKTSTIVTLPVEGSPNPPNASGGPTETPTSPSPGLSPTSSSTGTPSESAPSRFSTAANASGGSETSTPRPKSKANSAGSTKTSPKVSKKKASGSRSSSGKPPAANTTSDTAQVESK